MAMTDSDIIDDELSRILRLAYMGARSYLSEDKNKDQYHVYRAECILRSYIFGTEQQYEYQCAKHGAKLSMKEKH